MWISKVAWSINLLSTKFYTMPNSQSLLLHSHFFFMEFQLVVKSQLVLLFEVAVIAAVMLSLCLTTAAEDKEDNLFTVGTFL